MPRPATSALALINQTLDEAPAEQEGDFDADSRWALAWFERHGFEQGEFGVAETLSTAKNTSVAGMAQAGILVSQAETARELCYRLYTVCERKKRAPEALSYNSLVQSWPEILRLASERSTAAGEPGTLF